MTEDGDRRKGQEVVGVTIKQNISYVLQCTFSVLVKSLSEKCLLCEYLLQSTVAESKGQEMQMYPAHTRDL
jgi:hypothetical protein